MTTTTSAIRRLGRTAIHILLAALLLFGPSAAVSAQATSPGFGGHNPSDALVPLGISIEDLLAQDGDSRLDEAPTQDADPAYIRDMVSPIAHHDRVELAPYTIPAYARLQQTALNGPTGPAHQVILPWITQGAVLRPRDGVVLSAIVPQVDMKLLVIAADGNETDYPAIIGVLDQLGIPYDVLMAAETPLTWDMLSNGVDHAYYQGVILVTGNLGYYNPVSESWESAFDGNEWWTLWTFESMFGIRQVTSYTYPSGWPESYGLILDPAQEYVDTSATPLSATLTEQGKAVYPYLNTGTPITFKNAWVYLATVADPITTTPLVVTSQGHAIVSIHRTANGRENLTITAANNPYLIHSLLLSYGTINWVTRGVFLGEREVAMSPQVDDLLIDSDMWDIKAMTDTTGLLFRLTGSDFGRAIKWQNILRNRFPVAGDVTLEWAFNGEGATGIYRRDTLTPRVIADEAAFTYVNHTFTHENLDAISYDLAMSELSLNHDVAVNTLKLTTYGINALVQPDISGLYNPEFQAAAAAFGIEYLISDTSRPGWNNPSPNAGFYSELQPSILIIPRRPSNLFYNLSTPAEWVSEYNCYYGPTGTCAEGLFRYWDRDLTYEEILDVESEAWLQYLLKWDIDPLMFHQANVRAYSGNRSLLGDLMNATLAKYAQLYTLPIQGYTQSEIGVRMAARMQYNAANVQATLTPCTSLTLTAERAATVPITGLSYGGDQRVYGGQVTSFIAIGAGETVVIPLPACP